MSLAYLPPTPATGTDSLDLEAAAASWLLGYRTTPTRLAYARDLRDWLAFCHGHRLDPLQARRGHVDAWVTSQLDTSAAPASVARRLVAVRSWYDHLVHDLEVLDRNPAQRVKAPVVHDARRIPWLTPEILRGMAARARADGPDLELAFRMMAVNGLRIAEVVDMYGRDIGRAVEGTMVGMVHGKGGKTRVAVFTGRTAELVGLAMRRPMVRESQIGDHPLVEVSRRTIQRRVGDWGEQAGASRRPGCHALRHAAVTCLLNEGVSLRDVQDFAGHADPKTTRVYDRDAGAVARNPSRIIETLLNREDQP